jgi:hypothetical protein
MCAYSHSRAKVFLLFRSSAPATQPRAHRRCCTLTQLSLSGCGLGPVAALALASIALATGREGAAAAALVKAPHPGAGGSSAMLRGSGAPGTPLQRDHGAGMLASATGECVAEGGLPLPGTLAGHKAASPVATEPAPAAAAGSEAAPEKAHALPPTCLAGSLLHLNLARNPLGGEGLIALCGGLRRCTALRVSLIPATAMFGGCNGLLPAHVHSTNT